MTTDTGRPESAAGAPEKGDGWKRMARSRVGMTLVAVLVLLVLGTGVLKVMGKRPETLPEAPSVSVSVRTEAARVSDMPEVIVFAGRVEADPTVTLAFDLAGTVAALGADKGTTVTQGQMVVALDDRIPAATFEKARTGWKQAADDLRRFDELKKTGAVSESDYDGIKARADVAAATLKEAQAYYDKCRLLSPVNGVVEDRTIEVGEFAAPGVPVARVAAVDKLKILLDVPERDVFSLKAGQAVPVTVDALPGRSFKGRVTYVAPSADRKSNTFQIEIGLVPPWDDLRPGVIAKVSLTRRILTAATSVPLSALITSKGQYIAYVVKDGHAVRRVVKLVAMIGERAVVLEGIQPGEPVVVEGQRLVSDGVAVQEKAAAPVAAAPALPGA